MLVSEWRPKAGIFPLVVLVKVQPDTEKLEGLVLRAGQLQQKSPHHVLVALGDNLKLGLDVGQDGPDELVPALEVPLLLGSGSTGSPLNFGGLLKW